MMELTVHIPGLVELAEALRAHTAPAVQQPEPAAAPAQQPAPKAAPAQQPAAAPAPTAAPAGPITAPAQTAPAQTAAAPAGQQAPVQGSVPAQVPVSAAPSFTIDQVAKAGADLIAANQDKMSELLTLLQQFGVPAVQALRPEQLGAFATALRGLGAAI